MNDLPETQYATTSDGLSIAYQVWGEGSENLLIVPGIITHLEAQLEIPSYLDFARGLAAHFRLIRFDKRGNGMSDRVSGAPTIDERARDIEAVLDAAGADRAAVAGFSEGSAVSLVFAARHPERVTKLINGGGFAAGRISRGEWSLEEHEAVLEEIRANWGKPGGRHYFAQFGPPLDDVEGQADFARYCRLCATPSTIVALHDMNSRIDVREVLPFIHQPTLILRREGEPISRAQSVYLAEHIPNAEFRELPGTEHPPYRGDTDSYVRAIRDFVLGESAAPAPVSGRRVLASILFTDLVGSTEAQARLGDAAFRTLLDRHDDLGGDEIRRHGGRHVNTTGDGLLATFDAPTDAITCAIAIRERLAAIDLPVRAGVHTGEIELRGNDISGINVNIAARIADRADAGEILASDLTRQLMIGARIDFEARGESELKGVPGRWPLYAATGG